MELAKRITAIILCSVVLFSGIMAVIGLGFVPDSINAVRGEMPYLRRAPYISVRFDDDQAVEAGASSGEIQKARAMLFGIIPIKKINVSFVERESVELCGVPVGIKLDTRGVIVAETAEVMTGQGSVNPGKDCGLRAGDCILSANGEDISSAVQLIGIVERSEGKTVEISVLRQDGTTASLMLKPAFSKADGCYRAGIWIRNGMAGIGVLTFYDKETGVFGGLGHAVCDENSGAVMSVSNGEITSVMLTEIIKGASGSPGELVGFLGEEKYGTLTKNTQAGIYGYIDNGFSYGQGEYETALKQEIEEGKAQIAASVPGSDGVEFYDIVIEKINYDVNNPTRNMIVRVTDDKLLGLTGGIVQGMSGSPIIQNDRIVGAVTHVLVNDPTSGYGIFIENMLKAAR